MSKCKPLAAVTFLSGVVWAVIAAPGQEAPPATPVVTTAPSTRQAVVPLRQPSSRPASQASLPTAPVVETGTAGSRAEQLPNVTVFSDLDLKRETIAPAIGATNYTFGPSQIATTPAGENAPFQQVLLRAPGVVEDSFGQEHVRGEHANLTYRVNGVLLPDELSTFGQELDSHLIDTVTLIDGSLPAQFGFRTAGIIDVQTKTGAALHGGELSLYGGSYDTVNPSFSYGGTSGRWDYFLTGSYKHDSNGIEAPTGAFRPIHDDTDQERGFGYFSYLIDDTSRLSLLLNGSDADFQIPNTPDVAPSFMLAGHPSANSAGIDENQNEQNYYGVVSYQKSTEKFSMEASIFSSYSQIHFVPDTANDLIFQGVSGDVLNSAVTNGGQLDCSYIVNDGHTVRAGMIASYTREILDTTTSVFGVDPVTGMQDPSDAPFGVVDNSSNHAVTIGGYVQDEWHVTRDVTLNYGVRADHFDANFDEEGQISPRVNVVWKATPRDTFHAGFSRYFVTPPVQFVHPSSIAKFADTTNAPANFLDNAPKAERSAYLDLGLSHQIDNGWQVTLDGFTKHSHELIDEGQFGAPVIESPFNYKIGYVYGAELSSTYKQGGFSAFGNFAWVEARGQDINTQQFLIANDELAFIHDHAIRLDHESEYTASGGLSYAWPNDMIYVDVLYGSGLRSGFANTSKEPQYAPVNLGYEHIFRVDASEKNLVTLRVDLLNAFDESYQLRDGSGIGVGAAQFGARRALYLGLSYDF